MVKKLTNTIRTAPQAISKQVVRPDRSNYWSNLGAFLAIAIIGIIYKYFLNPEDNLFLIGSFGATAVIVFGSGLSLDKQMKNVIIGHTLSAFTGVTLQYVLPSMEMQWLAGGLAVGASLLLMQITQSVHPPGGATALIAVIGSEKVKALGYWYILTPVLSGVTIILLTAHIIHLLSKRHSPFEKE